MGELVLENMTLSDLQTTLRWAEAEGWNPGTADADAFLAADPKGFFVARLDGEPVAAISVVNHDADNTFLGLYICRPEWRGQGIGLSLWTNALKHAGDRSVGLDGVPEQEANYRKSGFVRTGQTLRYVGRVPPAKAPDVREAAAHDLRLLMELDAEANGFSRPKFIEAWLSPVPGKRSSRVLIRNGELVGFATWRACIEGTKIGPIVASDTKDALDLISEIALIRADGPLIIDIPEGNVALRRELERAGFAVPFASARMYRGRAPDQSASLQAIATMELG